LIRTISLGDPAAGADYATVTVPTNARWKVKSFYGQMVQGATQTPRPGLRFTDGTNTIGGGQALVVQSASTTINWTAAPNVTPTVTAIATAQAIMAFNFDDVILPSGATIVFNTLGLGAGSNWGAGFLQVEEWIDV
jgi:hypothetical protein